MPRVALLLPVVLCFLVACAPRQAGQTIVQHAGTDFPALEPEAYRTVVRDLQQAGWQAGAGVGERSGPLLLQELPDGGYAGAWLLADAEAGDRLVVTRFTDAGRTVWEAPLRFGTGLPVANVSLLQRNRLDAPVLEVDLGGDAPGAARRLLFALGADAPALIRATTAGGDLALARVAEDHPDLLLVQGDLGSGDRVEALAATVWLAAPAQRQARGKPGVRSHLEKLAVGTDTWLAQHAAELLTLPAG